MNPIAVLFIIISLYGAGSTIFARYEMKRADVLQVSLDQANHTIDEANKFTQEAEKASHEFQNRISDLNRKLAATRMREPVCIVIPETTPRRRDAAGKPGKLVGSVGVSSAWADELIAEGERYRLQVTELQQIVNACNGH